jgi:signal transduction histidine kinase
MDAPSDRGHFGLIGMRERVQLIGAQLAIHFMPGVETMVALQIPL